MEPYLFPVMLLDASLLQVSEDQFSDNCFKGSIVKFNTPCSDASFYLCEYLSEILELCGFSFHPCDFHSFILVKVHSICTSLFHLYFVLQSTKFGVNHSVGTKGIRINETSYD